MAPNTQKSSKAKAAPVKFIVDASKPASDKIFDIAAFEKFLQEKIKVNGRVGNLDDKVDIQAKPDGKIEIITTIPFSGRYLKYLTKKFLKKNELRDWLRVVAGPTRTYSLKFYNVSHEGDDDDDE